MESLSPNRQTLLAFSNWFGFIFIPFALALPPPGNGQMLMNLAPQALPNSSVGPSYTGTLNAVKQRLDTPTTGPIQSKPPQAITPDSTRRQTPMPSAVIPAGEICELKVSQMNDIQQHKVVRVHSGPCLMVFNAND